MSDLKFNTILGATLATALVIVGVQQVTGIMFETHSPEKPGYLVNAPEEAEAGAEEVVMPPDWGTVLPTADIAAGEQAFARCQGCHNVAPGGANGTGPALYGVVGAPVMLMGNFAYSDAMQAHKGVAPTWGYDELDQFLTSPAKYVPGTKMSFAGIRDQQTRINLIAWLRTQGPSQAAIPAPDPSRAPGAATAPAAAGDMPAEGSGAPAEGTAATEAGAPPVATAPAG